MVHLHPQPPRPTWAADWFTIVTVRFEILYAFVILDLGRREILRVRVTSTPSAQYAAQSFVEAVCDRDDQVPRFLIHDRDSIYGAWFRRRVKGFGTRCLATPPRAPQANSYCERVIRTLRREFTESCGTGVMIEVPEKTMQTTPAISGSAYPLRGLMVLVTLVTRRRARPG